MEILQVYAHLYVEKVHRIEISMQKLERDDIWKDADHREALTIELQELAELCVRGELPVTKILVDHIIGCFKTFDDPGDPLRAIKTAESMNNNLLAHYLLTLRDRMIHELSTKLFFQLPHPCKELFEKPRAKWESVIERFPETLSDIEEASKCFAVSRYTASVFHCVQIIEHGLIHLGKFLNVNDPYSGWTAVASKLKKIIDTDYKQRSDHEKKYSAFIEQMQGTVEALKNAWRNKISHAHGKLTLMGVDFTPDIAEEIMTASRSFMRRLAEELPK